MSVLPSNDLVVKLKEDAIRAPGAEERRAEEFYDSVADYDAVLRAHCRLTE
ncbi:MAG: hypothetical protein ABSB15_25700 [Bryobacteraceae bacterium]|jgi:hypothetical protein